jgi:hypothetical protein
VHNKKDENTVSASQFGVEALNDAYATLSSVSGKRMSVADVIAVADVQARMAQAAALQSLSEKLGGLMQSVAELSRERRG